MLNSLFFAVLPKSLKHPISPKIPLKPALLISLAKNSFYIFKPEFYFRLYMTVILYKKELI